MDGAATAPVVAEADTAEPVEVIQHWRWKGMAHKKKRGPSKPHGRRQKPNKGGAGKRKAEPVLATAGGAFAELAALRDSMKK